MKPSWICAPATRAVEVLKKHTSSKSLASKIGWQVNCCREGFCLLSPQEPPSWMPSMPPGKNAAGVCGVKSSTRGAPAENEAPDISSAASAVALNQRFEACRNCCTQFPPIRTVLQMTGLIKRVDVVLSIFQRLQQVKRERSHIATNHHVPGV